MDINDVRVGYTVLSAVLFVGIVIWTWARRRRSDFEQAALLPFADEQTESAGDKQ